MTTDGRTAKATRAAIAKGLLRSYRYERERLPALRGLRGAQRLHDDESEGLLAS